MSVEYSATKGTSVSHFLYLRLIWGACWNKIWKLLRVGGWGELETSGRVFSTWTASFRKAVVACTRPMEDQVSQHPVRNQGEAHQPPISDHWWLLVGEESVIFRGMLPWWVSHVLLEGPVSTPIECISWAKWVIKNRRRHAFRRGYGKNQRGQVQGNMNFIVWVYKTHETVLKV